MDDYISRAVALKFRLTSALRPKELTAAQAVADAIAAYIQDIPAVDVVEVVRCRECIYWRGENDLCKGICIDFDADGYCSEGKRKDGGQDYGTA